MTPVHAPLQLIEVVLMPKENAVGSTMVNVIEAGQLEASLALRV
jgi:hypothetical protein